MGETPNGCGVWKALGVAALIKLGTYRFLLTATAVLSWLSFPFSVPIFFTGLIVLLVIHFKSTHKAAMRDMAYTEINQSVVFTSALDFGNAIYISMILSIGIIIFNVNIDDKYFNLFRNTSFLAFPGYANDAFSAFSSLAQSDYTGRSLVVFNDVVYIFSVYMYFLYPGKFFVLAARYGSVNKTSDKGRRLFFIFAIFIIIYITPIYSYLRNVSFPSAINGNFFDLTRTINSTHHLFAGINGVIYFLAAVWCALLAVIFLVVAGSDDRSN